MSSGKHIQLPFGFVRGKEREKHIKLNLPPNYRKDFLFEQLPCLLQLDNLAIADVVKSSIVDNVSLQKYLMATSLWKDRIQDILNIIVSDDGKLSDAAVRRQLHTEFPSVMPKPISTNAIFKDQVKFDTQNPIISSLLTQIEIGKKQKGKEIKKNWRTYPL